MRYRGIFYIASVPSVAIFKNRYGGSEQWQQSDTLLQTGIRKKWKSRKNSNENTKEFSGRRQMEFLAGFDFVREAGTAGEVKAAKMLRIGKK